ncbi:MAG: hypothetical protein E7319_06135 [Clostridiales bacterium]|nr:hypothetical protein [Clostridiales bacterium]
MKCPGCGKWNRANLPHCVYCGMELPDDAYGINGTPAWQRDLKDGEKPKSYIRVDEYGSAETTDDPRDTLADDMARLKNRKIAGEQRQRMLRENAVARGMAPSGRSVRTTSNRSTFFSSYDDNPNTTLRPVAPELVENTSDQPGARRVYSTKYRTTYETDSQASLYQYAPVKENQDLLKPDENQTVYDGYQDFSEYIPDNQPSQRGYTQFSGNTYVHHKPRRNRAARFLRTLLLVAVLCGLLVLGASLLPKLLNANKDDHVAKATVTPTIRDDLATHTITIPGVDDQRITIRELHMTAIVIGGVATFDIPDHLWYEDYLDYLQESMTVTVSPFILSDSGTQTPLEQITYEIDIPLSPIDLNTPDNPYKVVSTALYTIEFFVREGSTVTINGEDYSDLVNTEGGKVSYNATVQPIGENNYEIVVRSQYCRENSMTVTLYREKQEIPLDLASDIGNTSSDKSRTMTIRATTLPGAVVKVLSPHTDLNITNAAIDGSFSFRAVFDKIGDNTIVITADYPGRKQTRVEHVVHYVPNIDVYSRSAWDIVSQYTDLMDQMELRKANSQIYVCKGVITSIETTKPQRAYMNVGTEESPLLVYVENSSKTQWVEGESYRLYGDVYGMYNRVPWLIVRYTYGLNESARLPISTFSPKL